MELHFIQEQIIKKLIATVDYAKYSDLRIKEIENDLFNYHLQKLVKLGIVEKSDQGYKLTSHGKKLTEDVIPLGVIRSKADMFKLYSHGIVIRMDVENLQILNRRRTKQPFYGDKGIIGESVRKGQDVKTALSARLLSQTGMLVDPQYMKLAGIIRKITYDQANQLFSDFIFYFHFCTNYDYDLDETLDKGNVFWVSIDEAIKNEENSQHPFPSLVKILKTLKANPSIEDYSPIFAEDKVSISVK